MGVRLAIGERPVQYFRDRRDAGRQLAARLDGFRTEDPVVVGLPRGGVPVAYEVALALGAPLDVAIVRKLGLPAQPELGVGAIGEGGVRVLNPRVLAATGVTESELATVEARERTEVERRAQRFRNGRPMVPVVGRTVIVVDDGLATGGTARAAIRTLRAHGARRVVLAVPVAPPDSVRGLQEDADEVVVLHAPPSLRSIGEWYADFAQTPDDEVVQLLASTREDDVVEARGPRARDDDVEVTATDVRLAGRLTVPAGANGLVVFAHGSGSGRRSPRNLAVARVLQHAGFGTLLFDLLTEREAEDRTRVFDVDLLARRLRDATGWLRAQPGLDAVPVGYFGASTGAGAALVAVADGAPVAAVVSRGGRPDLAGRRLAAVTVPTLLVVGELDRDVLVRNRDAAARLGGEHRLEVVPGASHLFTEPGTLEQAAARAVAWFRAHLGPPEAAVS